MNKSLEEMVSLPEFFLELSAAPLTALLVCLLMVTIQAHSRQRCVTKAQDSIIYPRTISAFALASVTQHGLIMLYPLRETLLSVKPRGIQAFHFCTLGVRNSSDECSFQRKCLRLWLR